VRIACIGQAGERLVRMACVMNDGTDGRAAGRTGLGAVMGSKNLKAIAVRGTGEFPMHDKAGLAASVKALSRDIVQTAKGFGKLGTAGGVPTHDKMGNWPIKNWAQDHWPEATEKISGAKLAESILTGRYYCGNCIIGCGRIVQVKEGPYAGIEQAGYEYETVSLNGSNLLLDDMAAIQKLNEICNRTGMDTISAGATLGFALEAYERGLIDKDFTDGIELTWGNGPALVEAMRRMGEREGKFGQLLGEGTRRLAEAIGGQEFAVHVRGLDAPAHDPRAFYANAVAYATSARGACHLSSFAHTFQRVVSLPELGYPEPMNRQDAEGTPALVMTGQNLMGLYDSLKICKFTLFGGVKPRHLLEWYNLVTGRGLTLEQLMEIGERIYTIKRMYTLAAAPEERDTLPPRFLTLPRDIGGDTKSLPPFEPMLRHYYELRGWDQQGRPGTEVLSRLGMQRLAPVASA
jgi:aldehyde:ferredoxin oxidoreductase